MMSSSGAVVTFVAHGCADLPCRCDGHGIEVLAGKLGVRQRFSDFFGRCANIGLVPSEVFGEVEAELVSNLALLTASGCGMKLVHANGLAVVHSVVHRTDEILLSSFKSKR